MERRRRGRPAADALAAAGLAPLALRAKEGLALINGTDGMLGMLCLAVHDLTALFAIADIVAAMSVEALLGTDRAFAADLQALRPQLGQAISARNMMRVLAGSEIVASHRYGDSRVQDAYSLRCTPQVHGAARDTLAHARLIAERELDAAIDNPMILPDGRVESCGNFHGAPLALVCDFLAIAISELAAIAERRTDRLLDAGAVTGAPAVPHHRRRRQQRLMIAHYTQAAMALECQRLAVPAGTSRCPPSAMQEDHVSNGWAAARKLRRSIANLRRVLAVELVCAAAGRSTCALRCSRRRATAAALAAVRGTRSRPRAGPLAVARSRTRRAAARRRRRARCGRTAVGALE